MYIRQTTLFSFEEIIKFQQQSRIEMILDQIDLSVVARKLKKSNYMRGPKGYRPETLIAALIAMQVEKIPTIKHLVKRLNEDPVFRYSCGFEVLGSVPSESTFSRFSDKLSNSECLNDLFHELVLKAKDMRIIDGTSVAIDSTKIDAFEASKPKKDITNDGVHPNWGMKRDTNGNKIRWFGWRLHLLCDSKSELPLEFDVTPASNHDGTRALPLIEQLFNSYNGAFKPKYYAMDSAYDIDEIYTTITSKFDGSPIIPYNPRSSYAPPEGLDKDLKPLCSGGYNLVYWGKDGDYMKFRCPHALGKVNCSHGMKWCSSSNYGFTLKVNYRQNSRFYSHPLRYMDLWQKEYDKWTSVERCNSRLKCYLNIGNIRSSGIKKAKMHVLLNCITLISGTIAVNKSKSLKIAA